MHEISVFRDFPENYEGWNQLENTMGELENPRPFVFWQTRDWKKSRVIHARNVSFSRFSGKLWGLESTRKYHQGTRKSQTICFLANSRLKKIPCNSCTEYQFFAIFRKTMRAGIKSKIPSDNSKITRKSHTICFLANSRLKKIPCNSSTEYQFFAIFQNTTRGWNQLENTIGELENYSKILYHLFFGKLENEKNPV